MSTGTLEDVRTRGGERGRAATTTATPTTPAQRRSTPRTSTPTRSTDPARTTRARAEEQRAGGTAPFVLLIMVLLTSGLVVTLWLSTAAAADSYRLDSARQVARDLSEQTERLHRDVETAQSAPAIAAAAERQGMVPGGVPAVLLVAPDGTTRVVGDPRPARAPARPVAAPAPVAAPRPAPAAVADPEVVAQTGAEPAGDQPTTDRPTVGQDQQSTGDDRLAAGAPAR